VGSTHAPEPGQTNEINVVNKMGLEIVDVPYWNNTTTQYAFLTDCEEPLKHLWREKPQSSTWVENSQLVMHYALFARWTNGWSDPRATYGVQA